MAVPAQTFQTYAAKGIREDLEDVIYRISPTQTPFLSSLDRIKAKATFHEWQTQDLAAAANNAQVEGDDATNKTVTPTVRLGNYTQISTKTIQVTGTQNAVNTAGRDTELPYQVGLAGMELKRDMEVALCQNTTFNAGGAAVARQLRGLEGWLATNADYGVGGVAPNYNTNVAPVDGTARAFTEAQFKSVAQQIWVQGGDPNKVLVSGTNKQAFSTFLANSTRFDKGEDKTVTASVDVYVTDFGEVKVMPNRFQRARTAFILQTDMWALATLRPMKTEELAKTGDSERRFLVCEYTLVARQEKSSGVVRDIT